MIIFAIALFCLSGLVFAISGVWTLALAFQRHVFWGLTVLLVPLGNVAFLFVNWREARVPFFLGLASLTLMGSAYFTMPQDSIRYPLRMAFAFVQADRQSQKDEAEAEMLAVREEAAQQIHLANLKRQEEALFARKVMLSPADAQGAQSLSDEIRKYNAQLKPLLAQLKTASR